MKNYLGIFSRPHTSLVFFALATVLLYFEMHLAFTAVDVHRLAISDPKKFNILLIASTIASWAFLLSVILGLIAGIKAYRKGVRQLSRVVALVGIILNAFYVAGFVFLLTTSGRP